MLAVASLFPSGENATPQTADECPLRVRSSYPVEASHNLMVRSVLTDASVLPSGDQARENTTELWP